MASRGDNRSLTPTPHRAYPLTLPWEKAKLGIGEVVPFARKRFRGAACLRLSIQTDFVRMAGFDGANKLAIVQTRNEGADSVQIKISARHGSLSEATQTKITAKVEKLTRRFERLTSITVTIDLEHRETPNVDIQVSAEHKHDFVAHCKGEELMTGLDQVIHKLEQQLRKYKDKIQDHHRTEGLKQQTALSESASADDDDDLDD